MTAPCTCSVCGGDHEIDAHRDPEAAARVWARAVLADARRASTAKAAGFIAPMPTEHAARYWAAHTALLLRRSS